MLAPERSIAVISLHQFIWQIFLNIWKNFGGRDLYLTLSINTDERQNLSSRKSPSKETQDQILKIQQVPHLGTWRHGEPDGLSQAPEGLKWTQVRATVVTTVMTVNPCPLTASPSRLPLTSINAPAEGKGYSQFASRGN